MRKREQEKERETNGMMGTRNMEGGKRIFFEDELRTVGLRILRRRRVRLMN